MRFFNYRRRFSSLSEQEILALAISSEEEDASIYRSFAAHLRAEYPASAAIFDGMAVEENNHRQQLTDLYVQRFGDHIPLLRREHVAGYYYRRPIWLMQNLGLDRIRAEAATMEQQAERFYLAAAGSSAALHGCSKPAFAGGPGGQRGSASDHCTNTRKYASYQRPSQQRKHARKTAVYPYLGAAGSGRTYGWVGVHTGAYFCHRLCHPKQRNNVSGWPCGLAGGGNIHGLHRSGLR